MERYTVDGREMESDYIPDNDSWFVDDEFGAKCLRGYAVELLADYERTGLTPSRVAELKERDTPKDAVNIAYLFLPAKAVDFGNCPICGRESQAYFRHCHYCGQALKWPELPEENHAE